MKIKNNKLIIQIICGLIAVGLWFMVMLSVNPAMTQSIYNIPIEINNLDMLTSGSSTFMLMDDIDELAVDVRVSGLKNTLLDIQSDDIKATAEITNFREGTNTFEIRISTPSQVEVENVNPQFISLSIDEIVSVEVDVEVDSQGTPEEGHNLIEHSSTPDTVIVRGPRSIVNSVSSANVTLDVEGATSTITHSKPVKLYDNTMNEISSEHLNVSPISIAASYQILPVKTVKITPVYEGVPAEGFRFIDIESSLKTIQIAAPREILDSTFELQTEPVDLTNLDDNFTINKNIVIGEEIIIISEESSTDIEVTIEKIEQKEFIIDFENVELLNLPENSIISHIVEGEENVDNENEEPSEDNIEHEQVIVTITAIESVLGEIEASDIEISIDFENSVEGDNYLLLTVDLEQEVDNLTIDKEYLGFNVERIVED